jgi:hypothetical protein
MHFSCWTRHNPTRSAQQQSQKSHHPEPPTSSVHSSSSDESASARLRGLEQITAAAWPTPFSGPASTPESSHEDQSSPKVGYFLGFLTYFLQLDLVHEALVHVQAHHHRQGLRLLTGAVAGADEAMRAPVPGEHDADRRAKRSSLKCLWRVRPRGVREWTNESRIFISNRPQTYLYRNVPFRSGRVAADSGISPALPSALQHIQ